MSPSANTNTKITRRWCPSPEQLMILEELYRRGLKTPKSSQIQKITAHLSLYGKIQGKNVFYWFQNHKARDRQKLRKKLQQQQQMYFYQQTQYHHINHMNHPFNELPTYYYQAHNNLHCPHPQYTAALDREGHAGVMGRTWSSSDLQSDCLNTIKSCGIDDFVMIDYMDVGPTTLPASPSCNNKDRPLQTLELFPLTPSIS